MVLVPSSRGTIYKSCALWKSVHRNDENRQYITVKYVNNPPKWADDDRTDWTMKTTESDWLYYNAHFEVMQLQWYV